MIRIGEFAKIFNLSLKTIRLYEEKGLIEPVHIDNYTGYRYYDESNIKDMTKILILKDLGLSLKEINKYNFNELDLKEKIENYKNQIKKIEKNITTLNTLLQKKEEIVNMKTFINDKQAIGKWSLIGISNTKEDAKNKIYINDDFKINEIYFLPNGEEYWIIKWTKGFIYLNDIECPYEIIGNIMYINIIDPLEKSHYKIAAYEKQDNKEYTIEEIELKDNINLEFKEDKYLIGFWKSIDFVKSPENFNPVKKYWKSNLYLSKIIVSPDNSCIANYNGKEKQVNIEIKYTKDYFIELCSPNTVSKYTHKKVNNTEYIIVEWKSGDYVYGKMINGYYVLEKMKEN